MASSADCGLDPEVGGLSVLILGGPTAQCPIVVVGLRTGCWLGLACVGLEVVYDSAHMVVEVPDHVCADQRTVLW